MGNTPSSTFVACGTNGLIGTPGEYFKDAYKINAASAGINAFLFMLFIIISIYYFKYGANIMAGTISVVTGIIFFVFLILNVAACTKVYSLACHYGINTST